MLTLTRRALLLAGLATLPFAVNCNDANEPTNRYDLVITNNSATAYEIWANTGSGTFAAAGPLGAMSQVRLQNLILNQSYVFRLSTVGTGPNTFAYEMTVMSATTADVTWTVP